MTDAERKEFTWWDCTCESDAMGRCAIPSHQIVIERPEPIVEED